MEEDTIHPSCRDGGCTSPAKVAGRCVAHAIAEYRGRVKAKKPPVARHTDVPTCSFDGCGRVAPVHELCLSHRRQLDRNGRLTPIRERAGRRYI